MAHIEYFLSQITMNSNAKQRTKKTWTKWKEDKTKIRIIQKKIKKKKTKYTTESTHQSIGMLLLPLWLYRSM